MNTALSKQLDIGVKQAERRAKKAIKFGWLVNREQRKYHAADYATGELMPEVEGLPLLEYVDTVDTADITDVHDFSLENRSVDTLIPLTDSETYPPTTDSHEAILGMSISRALEMWRAAGAPIIHLGPVENCLDLVKLLSRPDVKEPHLESIRAWLNKVQGGES